VNQFLSHIQKFAIFNIKLTKAFPILVNSKGLPHKSFPKAFLEFNGSAIQYYRFSSIFTEHNKYILFTNPDKPEKVIHDSL